MNTAAPSVSSATAASIRASSSNTATSGSGTQQLVRLAEGGAASPYIWRGLLPTLGLTATFWFALGPFASGEIEAAVAHEVRSQLQAKGHGWVTAVVSGQEVLLSGSPPRAGAGDEALALARAATCPTWSGPRTCAVTVIGAFGNLAAPGAPALPAAPAVGGGAASGAAATPSPAALACEAAFAKLLESARIEFASGGAAIDARSAQLLDQLAATARGCPGRILIEGHTDNVGDAESNRRLSEARAAAVREALLKRGVPATQLEALGFGPTRPLADNGSEAGRAANRRIEFKALP